jgi:hypothetical protein
MTGFTGIGFYAQKYSNHSVRCYKALKKTVFDDPKITGLPNTVFDDTDVFYNFVNKPLSVRGSFLDELPILQS